MEDEQNEMNEQEHEQDMGTEEPAPPAPPVRAIPRTAQAQQVKSVSKTPEDRLLALETSHAQLRKDHNALLARLAKKIPYL